MRNSPDTIGNTYSFVLVNRFEKLAADGFMFMDVHMHFAAVNEDQFWVLDR